MEDLLYHYTSQDGLIGIIESKSIWASNIHYLNDSKEFQHAIDELKAIIYNRKKNQNNELIKKLYNSIEGSIGSFSRINIFVASLTEKGDQLSQWRGYCQNGAGYSIGFSKSEIESLSNQQGFTFKPCIYAVQQQRKLLTEPLERLEKKIISSSGDPELAISCTSQFFSEFLQIAPLLKHRAFSEEQEWRLVSGIVSSTDNRWKTRSGSSTLIPYFEFSLNNNDHSPIRNVIPGPGPNQELTTNALMTLLTLNGVNEVSASPSQIPYRTT